MHHVLTRSCAAALGVHDRATHSPGVAAPVAIVAASSALHAQTSLQTCETVCRDAVNFAVAATSFVSASAGDAELAAVGILAGQIEKVDTSKDREEATEEGDGVACIDCVEPLE